MIYPCGCINEIDAESGVMHCIKKCDYHVTWSLTHPTDCIEHYAEMSCLVNGIPQNKKLIEEFIEGFINELEFLRQGDGNRILEIGCGIGMYVPFFLENHFSYCGIEPAKFAAYWTQSTFNVLVYDFPFEQFKLGQPFEMILGAHVFEHLKDSPAMLAKAFDMLTEKGKLFLILPDDTDPVNPDHWWFFTPDTLRALLKKTGFVNVRMNVKQVVEREKFIYCVAEKP